MKLSLVLFVLPALVVGQTTFQPHGVPFKTPVTVAPGFKANVLFSNLTTPRGIAIDNKQNILVVERGVGITAFSKVTGGWNRKVVVSNTALTHGIVLDGKKLYASTSTQVLRYAYQPASQSVSGSPVTVINNLPGDGELPTHPLLIEKTPQGATNLMVSTGPLHNIDTTARDASSGRSQIRRFPLSATSPQTWLSGTLVSYGIRYPSAFALSALHESGVRNMWILENGASIDALPGMTAPFANDNPADELNVVDVNGPDGLGRYYGFPDCTTLWNGDADPVGFPQYVGESAGRQISLGLDPARDDDWCLDGEANNTPSIYPFQAHSVPLDIKFYPGRTSSSPAHAFPNKYKNDAFIAFHGSFNRNPPTGYGVVWMPFRDTPHVPAFEPLEFIIQNTNLAGCPTNCLRPVGLVFGNDGRLYATSDGSNELFVIGKA